MEIAVLKAYVKLTSLGLFYHEAMDMCYYCRVACYYLLI